MRRKFWITCKDGSQIDGYGTAHSVSDTPDKILTMSDGDAVTCMVREWVSFGYYSPEDEKVPEPVPAPLSVWEKVFGK
jgi:hypothetical protein